MNAQLPAPHQAQHHQHQLASTAMTRIQVLEVLTRELPMNELGLPKYLYRCDLIPEDLFQLSEGERNAYLNSATIPITYREGYPTFFDGTPIWEQMDAESDGDYGIFQLYIGLSAKHGYRQLAQMPDEIGIHFPQLKAGDRQAEKNILSKMQELFALNFWFHRAKAYDLFKTAMFRKVRERRMMEMEDYHYIEADNILKKLMNVITTVLAPEKLEQLEPLDFIKAFKEAAAIQQRALGLGEGGRPGARKGDDEHAPPPGASVELTLRQIAKQSGASDTAGGGPNNANVIELLQRPETAEAAQELIIKLNVGNRRAEIAQAGARDEAADLAMVTGDDEGT